jgi:hypothetical protein
MSRDIVNSESETKQDISWDSLISASESKIKEFRGQIGKLRKSLVFFKKQRDSGVPFPINKKGRHLKIS